MKKLWDLNVAPRVRHFLWLTFKGRVNIAEYLYSINLGRRCFCTLCNVDHGSIEHLLVSCCKAQAIWNQISLKTGVTITFLYDFCNGDWLVNATFSPYIKSIITTITWYIWKSRCDKIFRNINAFCQVITCRTIVRMLEFSYVPNE